MSRGHWVGVKHCVKAGRCFHLERVEWMLRASSNVAETIACSLRREAYVEGFLRKAILEEGFASQCPVYCEPEASSVELGCETFFVTGLRQGTWESEPSGGS